MTRRIGDLEQYQRPRLDEAAVVELLHRFGVDADSAADLGGTMSLNIHLPETSEVLRLHQRFASRARVVGLREVRRHVAEGGLIVGTPTPIEGRDVIAAGPYLAEVETYVDHVKPPPEWASYVWMYRAMGRLHRRLAEAKLLLPRPIVATYGPPRSLRRWLRVTEQAVVGDSEAREIVMWARRLTQLLDRQWVPATSLPCQLVHGDVRLGNVALAAGEQAPAYLDFGFTAVRPTVHDLAYSLPWIIVRPDGAGCADNFDWSRVTELLDAYEDGARRLLSDIERQALRGYVAAVPLYMAATAGFTAAPGDMLRSDIAFFRIAEWVLTRPLPGLPPITHT